jgi:hypothetical protein
MNSPVKISTLSKTPLFLGVVGLLGLGISGAEQWETTVSRLQPAIAKAYVSSVPSGFGANLNTGWYRKAPTPTKIGFNIEGGIVAMATLVGSGKKTLNVASSFTFDDTSAQHIASRLDTTGMGPNAGSLRDSLISVLMRDESNVQFRGPTILGSNRDTIRIYYTARSVVVPTSNGTDTVNIGNDTVPVLGATGLLGNLPGLMSRIQAIPLFIPQLTFGTVMGTNVTVRWLPETQTLEELGTVELFGVGIQHNPAIWFEKKLPVDFSVGYFNQKLEVGNMMVAKSWAAAFNVSKTFGERFVGVTPYGGLQYEKTTLDFTYNYRDMDGNEQPVSFTVEGENKVRATVGINVRVLAINLNADLALAKYPVGSFGVMVGI